MLQVILTSATRSLVLAVLVLLLFAAFRVRHPGVRKVGWATVLIGSFLMPVLGGHLLQVRPLWSRASIRSSASSLDRSDEGIRILPDSNYTRYSADMLLTGRPSGKGRRLSANLILSAYALISLVLLVRIAIGLLRAKAVWGRAAPQAGIHAAGVRSSIEVLSPWTFGSKILLPATASSWSIDSLLIVLAHEREHIRQRDFYLQLGARIYTALFWVSPLGWWLQAECARLGEQTSDFAALQYADSAADYADLLMSFCTDKASHGLLYMARVAELRRRVDLVLNSRAQEQLFRAPTRAAVTAALLLSLSFALATASTKVSQVTQTLSNEAEATQEWERMAGGAKKFEAASIRPSSGDFKPPTFPMSADDSFRPSGGLFFADFPLSVYILFAYKLSMTPEQMDSALSKQPVWARRQRFTISARADANTTKDQYRLMMQDLLRDRFSLKLHFTNEDTPIFAMTLIKPGSPGPKLRSHAEGPPCSSPTNEPYTAEARTGSEIFPVTCSIFVAHPTIDHLTTVGARDTTIDLIGSSLASLENLVRPVINKTGLHGRFDFTLTWKLNMPGPNSTQDQSMNDIQGPNFDQALRDQLGIKISSGRALVSQPVIDHLELPTEN